MLAPFAAGLACKRSKKREALIKTEGYAQKKGFTTNCFSPFKDVPFVKESSLETNPSVVYEIMFQKYTHNYVVVISSLK